MAQIVVRGIPDEELDVLDARARRQGRSREEEVRRLIAAAVDEERAWSAFLERASELRKRLRTRGRRFSDSARLIREDRERR
ncbi:MAG: ribbon-helix-helix protein, CopG family [Gemmatimonadetes bacterium]|nr:ribbon-helix-helix protein, CopG family [Gemmatimonadota bacterium]